MVNVRNKRSDRRLLKNVKSMGNVRSMWSNVKYEKNWMMDYKYKHMVKVL